MHGDNIFMHEEELVCSRRKAVEEGCPLELQESAHLYGATEGHLAIALAEVHVSH